MERTLKTWGEVPELRIHTDGSPYWYKAFRRALVVNAFRNGVSISVVNQCLTRDTGKWLSRGSSRDVALTTSFRLGSLHTWYDGAWCCWSFGFLHVTVHGRDDCRKCQAEI